ncbi:beta-carotene hydroxylase 2, chloroplastic-like [Nymphaea colorata]|nr:beta-carotene hydroxylase 2, chloroplastic-like [Nymphaea colorata]
MTARISAAAASTTCCLCRKVPIVRLRGASGNGCVFFLRRRDRSPGLRKLTVCFFMEKRNETADHKLRLEKKSGEGGAEEELWKNEEGEEDNELPELTLPVAPTNQRQMERSARRKMERYTYLTAAILSSVGITSMAAASVYYRFAWQMEGGEVPMTEMLGTFALSVGAAVGMEFWARWAHRALWHASMWAMHESHHRPREGPFELNDVFAIINAVPAIALLHFGFFHRGLFPGLCFGAGLGITVYGMAYMFVHDGLVHKRFPVGPIADVPYLRRVASAHQIHHADKFDGVPYGLFLGPKEVEEVGGLEELDKEIRRRMKASNNRSSHVSTKE